MMMELGNLESLGPGMMDVRCDGEKLRMPSRWVTFRVLKMLKLAGQLEKA